MLLPVIALISAIGAGRRSPPICKRVSCARVVAVAGSPPHEALVVWGVNGPDSTIQRVFTHSQHGHFGIYQGRRAGSEIAIRQMLLAPQPDSVVVENLAVIRDRDHFTITSRLSNDRGRTWQALSRWEYRRTS